MTQDQKAGLRATVNKQGDREILTVREFDAPRERVFEAFTDPARLARWWGPKGFTNTFQEFDLRPGGRGASSCTAQTEATIRTRASSSRS